MSGTSRTARTRVTMLALVCLAGAPASAFADMTIFTGVNTTPANRTASGFSVGANRRAVGAEFEFSSTSDDAKAAAPSLRTGTASLVLQTPVEPAGFQPYVTAGAGLYRETLTAQNHQDTGFALSTGGGIKFTLIGTLRLRVDYRVFRLGGGALNSPAHRVYAGLNVKF